MQDTGKARESCPNETLVLGEAFECVRRSCEQGVVREALMRTDKRTQGLRDRAGDEEGWSGELSLQVVG